MELGGNMKKSRRAELARVMALALQKEGMTPTAVLVLAALWTYAHDDGAAWPTTEQLMQRTGLKETAIKSARKVLERTQTILTNDDNRVRIIVRRNRDGTQRVCKVKPGRRLVLIYELSRKCPEGIRLERRFKPGGHDTINPDDFTNAAEKDAA